MRHQPDYPRRRTRAAIALGCLGALLLSACDRRPPPPEVRQRQPLSNNVLGVFAVGEGRAAVLHRPEGSAALVLTMWDAGRPTWSVDAPCDPRAGDYSVSAAPDLVTIQCASAQEPRVRTSAFRVLDGSRAWVSASRRCQSLAPSTLHSDRTAATVLERCPGGTLAALDAATGAQRWEAEGVPWQPGATEFYPWGELERLFVERHTDKGIVLTLHDTKSGAVRWEGDAALLCRLSDAVLAYQGNDLVRIGLDSSRVVLPFSPEYSIANCGSRHGQPVLAMTNLKNDSSALVVLDSSGAEAGRIELNRVELFGHPFDWREPLPRYLPVMGDPSDRLLVINLDDLKIVRTLRLATTTSTALGAEAVMRARVGDLFVASSELRLFAVDGRDGRILASDQLYLQGFHWLESRQAVWGEHLLLPRAAAAGAVLESPQFTSTSALAVGLVAGSTIP